MFVVLFGSPPASGDPGSKVSCEVVNIDNVDERPHPRNPGEDVEALVLACLSCANFSLRGGDAAL